MGVTRLRRKVAEIGCHDNVCLTGDRSGEYVAILRLVGHRLNKWLVAANHGVGKGASHGGEGLLEVLHR